MDTKHTPGPWKVFNSSWSETVITAPNFDHGICLLDINHATEESQEADEAQMEANARLIAAAPELLSELQSRVKNDEQSAFENWLRMACPSGDVESVQRQWEESSDFDDFLNDTASARAAIAKATGKEA